jgi:ferredoxin
MLVLPSGCGSNNTMVLKRVMRRALRGEPRRERDAPRTAAPRTTAPRAAAPRTTPTVAPPTSPAPRNTPTLGGSIASRLASGLIADPAAQVKATSGNQRTSTAQAIHTAEDGTSYWGLTDNESSRAKAAGQTLIIDQWECISCGTCVENTDAVFALPDDAKAVPTAQEGDMELIQDAIDACPVTCIHWSEDPTTFEQLNDADGNLLG